MNNPSDVMNNIYLWLRELTLWGVVKWFSVMGLVMYAVFAAVIVRQAMMMSETVDSDANWIIILFSWLHLIMAGLLVVMAIVIL